ncbi:FxsA family protein [Beijerinckia sp. L45]|uniref:FxsA family protein n=1 Tax=Beijerinckia sp. L45 TaxID=1641855 RepID=UPI00131A6AFA|nr:FxsA family protein [Beijerinckia sp. L45]
MTLRTRISLALTLWFVAEAIALALIVQVIGVGGAVLLGIATSLLGGSLLKKAGRSALSALRQTAGPGGTGVFRGNLALDGTLGAIGALFLLLPGFLTDAIGLVLATPLFRAPITRWIQGGGFRTVRGEPRAQHGPTSIDLEPGDWQPVDDAIRRPLPKV